MSQLNTEQESVLANFKEFTSYNEEEEKEKVLRLLTVCNWNLEVAVARYFEDDFPTLFDERPGIPTPDYTPQTAPTASGEFTMDPFTHSASSYSPADGSVTPANTSARDRMAPQAIAFDHPFADVIPKLPKAIPIPNNWKSQVGLATGIRNNTKKNGFALFPPIVFILMLFPKLFWVVGYGLNKILGPIFPTLFRLLGLRAGPNDLPSKPVYTTKEEVETHDIKKFIDETLGETSDLPVFEEGEFNDAFNLAKSELRWLMCILVNSKSDFSTKFIKTYLNNDQFIKFITENNIILYVGDVCYPEAFEVGKIYHAYSVPYVNLIANVSSNGLTFPLMSTVTRFQNFESLAHSSESSKKLVKRLQRIVDKYEPQLITQRIDRQETQFARLIRQQQDEAYEQSLLSDKIKQEEKKQKELAEAQRLEKLKQEQDLIELKKKQEAAFFKVNLKVLLDRDDKAWAKGDFTTIQLRNHEGQRIIKRFYKDETLYDIFLFVACKNYVQYQSKELGKTEKELIDEYAGADTESEVDISDYKHDFKFDLVSAMPRMRFAPDGNRLLKDVKELWPNGSLLIEKSENDDDEDEDEDVDDNDDDSDK